MNDVRTDRPIRRYLLWGIQGVAGILGALWGYDFGNQVSGVLLGVVAGVNAAAFAALLAGAAGHRLLGTRAGAGVPRS